MTPLERRAVASLSVLYVLRMLGLFMVLPLLSLYGSEMPHATPMLIGLALGAYGLSQALLQIPLGWLSDSIGRKQVIVGGLLVFALGSVIAATADSIWGIVCGRTLQGAGAIAGTVLALVADLTREEQRTKAMAVVGISIGSSFTLALIIGPLIAGFGGLSAVFWFTALLALCGLAIVVTWVPRPLQAVPLRGAQGTSSGKLRHTLADSRLLRCSYGVFALHFILMSCFLVVPTLLLDLAQLDPQRHWTVYLPVLLLSLLGMVPLMALADRRGQPRLATLLALAALLAALLSIAWPGGKYQLFAGLWLFFVGFNFLEASLPSAVSKCASPEAKGTAMGVFSTAQFLGAFFGGAAGGVLLQWFGVLALLSACLLLAVLWFALELKLSGATNEAGEPAQIA